MVFRILFAAVGRDEEPLSGNDIVKQIMVARRRSEGVVRIAFLPTVLKQGTIDEIFIGEQSKRKIRQKSTSSPENSGN